MYAFVLLSFSSILLHPCPTFHLKGGALLVLPVLFPRPLAPAASFWVPTRTPLSPRFSLVRRTRSASFGLLPCTLRVQSTPPIFIPLRASPLLPTPSFAPFNLLHLPRLLPWPSPFFDPGAFIPTLLVSAPLPSILFWAPACASLYIFSGPFAPALRSADSSWMNFVRARGHVFDSGR
ncbi:hypothetical protein FB451DRAFT_1409204 [Mycena latifolia]|nr:hypothetical protein FB451DRAFT_1409204 [Mycena latifolia]